MVIIVLFIALINTVFVNNEVDKNWTLVKSLKVDSGNSYLITFESHNSNLLLKSNNLEKTINGPGHRAQKEFFIINSFYADQTLEIYTKPTFLLKEQFDVEFNIEVIEKNKEKYFLNRQIISELWYQNTTESRKQAVVLVEDLLNSNYYSQYYYDTLNIYLWILDGQQKYVEIISFYESLSEGVNISWENLISIKWSYGIALLNTGGFLSAKQQFEEILNTLNDLDELSDSWEANIAEMNALLGLTKSILFFNSEKSHDNGLIDLNKALNKASNLGDYKLISDVLYHLGSYYSSQKEWKQALATLTVAEEYLDKANTRIGLYELLNQKGLAYKFSNQLVKSQQSFRVAVSLINDTGKHVAKANIFYNLATIYELLGDTVRSVIYYNLSKETYINTKNKYGEIKVNTSLGAIERVKGNYVYAEKIHSKNLTLSDENFKNMVPISLIELSRDYLSQGNLIKAKRAALKALVYQNILDVKYIHSKDKLLYLNGLLFLKEQWQLDNLLDLLTELKEKELLDIYLRTKELIVNKFSIIEFKSLLILTKVLLEESNFIEAKKLIVKLEGFTSLVNLSIDEILLFKELKIDYYAIVGDYENLNNEAINTIAFINKSRKLFDVSDMALHWARQTKSILNKYINALVAQNKYEEIFELLEKYYAVNLREKRFKSIEKNIAKKSKEIQQSLAHYVKHERENILVKDINKQNQVDEAKEHFLALNNETDSPIKKIELELLSIKQLQEKLAIDELFLRYYIDEENVFVYVIDKDAYEIKKLPNLTELHDNVKNIITSTKSKRFSSLINNNAYAKILPHKKILSQKYRKIIIIPDGILNLLPFGSINISPNEGEYIPLATQIEIERTYSASDYFSEINIERNADTITVFANPIFLQNSDNQIIKDQYSQDNKLWEFKSLPYTDKEAQYIANIFPDSKINLLNGNLATNENFLSEESRSSNIIHIATHGFFNDKSLENVGIATSVIDKNGNQAPGILAMREILYQPFKANLAVVSGCETTLGKEISGEGFNSLSRGLLSQGVNSVIGTIWSISDRATPVFMKEFYTNLRGMNGNVSKALNTTKSNFATQPQFRRYRHPYYWAGFVLTSSNRGISENIFK